MEGRFDKLEQIMGKMLSDLRTYMAREMQVKVQEIEPPPEIHSKKEADSVLPRQKGTVAEYWVKIEAWAVATQVKNQERLMDVFMVGVDEEIREDLLWFHPATPEEMVSLAQSIEERNMVAQAAEEDATGVAEKNVTEEEDDEVLKEGMVWRFRSIQRLKVPTPVEQMRNEEEVAATAIVAEENLILEEEEDKVLEEEKLIRAKAEHLSRLYRETKEEKMATLEYLEELDLGSPIGRWIKLQNKAARVFNEEEDEAAGFFRNELVLCPIKKGTHIFTQIVQ